MSEETLVVMTKAVLDRNGVEILDNGDLESMDSISFITMIVDLESEFNTSIPDEYLSVDYMCNLENLINVLKVLVN